MDYEVREFDEEGELYFVTHFGDYEQDAWEYAEGLAKKGIYAEVHTQSTYEGCNRKGKSTVQGTILAGCFSLLSESCIFGTLMLYHVKMQVF